MYAWSLLWLGNDARKIYLCGVCRSGKLTHGQGLEDSLTRQGSRLQILLLVSTLASFVSWLAGLGCEATGIAQWLLPHRTTRKLYSTLRVGREALVRRWPLEPISNWLERLRSLPAAVTDQMTLTT